MNVPSLMIGVLGTAGIQAEKINIFSIIIGVMGGLGLFLYGMRVLSDGLRKLAGPRMRTILEAFTRSRYTAVIVGVGITSLFQSSSATTVMVVGLVNSGLLALRQAIGVIMGANIGTTITAWIVSLTSVKIKIEFYAFPAIGIGFTTMAISRMTKRRLWGETLLGFGMLFLGLMLLKDAFGTLKDLPVISDALEKFSHNPILGVLVGMVVTILLQSSSASIAIIQSLAAMGLISFEAAIPLILGDNIGTTITAQLASIGGSTNGRRAARAHAIFNIIGVLYMLPIVWLGWYSRFIDFLIPGTYSPANVMVYIALSHTVFNVANTIIFLPLVGVLERLCIKFTTQNDDEVDVSPQYLTKALLDDPPLAIEQAKKEIIRMIRLAKSAILNAQTSFFEPDVKLFDKVAQQEDGIDTFQVEITNYLVSVSERNLMPLESEEIPVLLHSVNDIERIGDHAENLTELSQQKFEGKLPFTEDAFDDLKEMSGEINRMIDLVIRAIDGMDKEVAKRALEIEDRINGLQKLLSEKHIKRLGDQQCNVISGILYLDFVSNLEKIGDHLTNIAQAVMKDFQFGETPYEPAAGDA